MIGSIPVKKPGNGDGGLLVTWSFASTSDRHPEAKRRRAWALEYLEQLGAQMSPCRAIGVQAPGLVLGVV